MLLIGVEQVIHQRFIKMFLLIINFFEIVTAIFGTVYIKKYREDKISRYFVYFLWFTALFDTFFGWMPSLIENYDQLFFLKDTFLYKNHWAYNSYDIISFSFYLFFFLNFIESTKAKKIGVYSIILFIVTSLLNLILSGVFFESPALFSLILGTLLLLFFIIYFYFQVLQSDKILDFYKILVFYISVGALVFHILVNPIFIYGEYYSNTKSPEFVEIYRSILTFANIFMYTCYTIGFIVCSRKNRSYY
ncbi:hypothetical protein [Aquimarina sp. 2201CG14-23]|uniref:hypothetical protein n=1 Tax=Aquimarina mycalae TaxID=3040073 RepID=UPI002477EB66|nr:hypothetical protein [Aquimarina sp. 2201CG14-23]MDH7444117.1 hypothetical protein [Aquimarina sp. 2201CG14-23]